MSTFTIAQLSEMSGVKPHTIRVWEQRYHLLRPQRTTTNIRRYDDRQLRKLLNTVTLVNSGEKISTVASYSEKEIESLIAKEIEGKVSPNVIEELLINQLIAAGLSYNETDFEKGFASSVLRFGLMDAYSKIIYPLLERTGLLWTNSRISPCQEHFITNIIKRKLFTAVDSLPLPVKPIRKWLLFLPENEFHETGLLFANYMIRKAGQATVYLGQSVPYDSLTRTIDHYKPTGILFFTVRHFPVTTVRTLIKNLSATYNKTYIVVATGQKDLAKYKTTANVHVVNTVGELQSIISES
jgi:DNA-binding transcriptional MerR regulator